MTIKFLSKLRSRGFTMIELLVVIAVIGVLAVAVLSSINPIEQINKGRDTRLRSNAAQLINALDRYYAIQEEFTWNTLSGGAASLLTPDLLFPDGVVYFVNNASDPGGDFYQMGGGVAATAHPWLTELANVAEVKQSFIDQINDTSATNILLLRKDADGDVFVCFAPASNQFKIEALKGCGSRKATMPTGACDTTISPYIDFSAAAWQGELICLP